MTDTITLEFLGTQQLRILNEMSTFRSEMSLFRGVMQDDIRVLLAMAQRQDNETKAIIEEIRRMNRQQSLVNEQLLVINEQLSVINRRLSAMDNINERLSIIEGRVAKP
jgi:hypothetical protein